MKNIVNVISIFLILFLCTFSTNIYAASLENVSANLDKGSIKAGDNVTVTFSFGRGLGSYTVDFAYNNDLFDYVSADGGTANDNGTRVRVYFYDQSGGSEPRTSVSATFKAKTSIKTTTNANFSITANGLASAEGTVVTYDDITTPIVKTVTINPVEGGNQPSTEQPNNGEGELSPTQPTETPNTQTSPTPNNQNTTTNGATQNTTQNTPTSLPKTGNTVYAVAIAVILVLSVVYIFLGKKDDK